MRRITLLLKIAGRTPNYHCLKAQRSKIIMLLAPVSHEAEN